MAIKTNKTTFAEYEPDRVLWSDRKRWLGLPWTFTKYTVDENRLYIKTGFLNSAVDETLLYRILDIKMSRTLWQRIFGVGTVTLYCTDKTNQTVDLKNVRDSEKLRRFLSEIVEQRRNDRGVVGREILGTGGYMPDLDGDGIPDAPPPPRPEDFLDDNR